MNYSNHDCRVRPGLRKIRTAAKVERKPVATARNLKTEHRGQIPAR